MMSGQDDFGVSLMAIVANLRETHEEMRRKLAELHGVSADAKEPVKNCIGDLEITTQKLGGCVERMQRLCKARMRSRVIGG